MKTVETGYSEELVMLAGEEVRIASYRVVDQFVCVISNADPGAVIARAVGDTRSAALELGRRLAEERILGTESSQIETPPAIPSARPTCEPVEALEMDPGISAKVRYSLAEFLELPILDRMAMMLSGKLQYFTADGKAVPPGTALEYIHQAIRNSSAA